MGQGLKNFTDDSFNIHQKRYKIFSKCCSPYEIFNHLDCFMITSKIRSEDLSDIDAYLPKRVVFGVVWMKKVKEKS